MTPYERYCASMRERGLDPTMSEPQLLEAWGIKQDTIVETLSIRPKRDARKIEASLSNHIKITAEPKPKKAKAVKKELEPKKKKEVKTPPKQKREKLTPEQVAENKRKYQREYMVRYRKLNPHTAYAGVKAWREASKSNADKHREWNRDYMRRKRAEKLKA